MEAWFFFGVLLAAPAAECGTSAVARQRRCPPGVAALRPAGVVKAGSRRQYASTGCTFLVVAAAWLAGAAGPRAAPYMWSNRSLTGKADGEEAAGADLSRSSRLGPLRIVWTGTWRG
jgi:hypothetical protein